MDKQTTSHHFLYIFALFLMLGTRINHWYGLLPYIGSLLLGYIIGSIPTAYLLVRWTSRVDIRKVGSGNVGAMNTFDVTRSKWLGIAVFFIDMLKGAAAVLCAKALLGNEFWVQAVSGVGAVIGHNYPVWLRFKGGRGLSTAVGVMLILWWIIIPIWCIVWTIHRSIWKNVHSANIIATIVTPAVLLVAPASWLAATLPHEVRLQDAMLFSYVVFTLILLRHVEHIRQLFSSTKQ
jgi:glycerol-3-phosphate acyltransferase PlsY